MIKVEIGRIGWDTAIQKSFTKADKINNESSGDIKDTFSCSSKAESTPAKRWTIMHYAAGDNNLKEVITGNINDMEKAGSNDDFNVIVQLDNGGDDCKRYYITKDDDSNKINSPVVENMGNVNMSDPKSLAGFVKFAEKNFPADKYALIISDHGSSWSGAVEDETSKGWMSLEDINKGIEEAEKDTGKKLDVLGFDCCTMSNTEVMYQMQNRADYIVASEQNISGEGWPYFEILTDCLYGKPAYNQNHISTPVEFSKNIIDTAKNYQDRIPTLAAIDTSKIGQLAKTVDKFAQSILATDTPKEVLNTIGKKTINLCGNKDLHHFAKQVSESGEITDENLKIAAKATTKAVEDTIISAERKVPKYQDAYGLSIEIPAYRPIQDKYLQLAFSKDTHWDEAMERIYCNG